MSVMIDGCGLLMSSLSRSRAGSCSRSAALGEYHQAARLSPAILHRVCGDGEAHGGNQQAGRTPDRCPEPRIPHHFALLRSMAWGRRAASIVQ